MNPRDIAGKAEEEESLTPERELGTQKRKKKKKKKKKKPRDITENSEEEDPGSTVLQIGP